MRVGANPLLKAAPPSVLRTVLTQSKVVLYLRPVSAVKPSVCILDLMTSMGYIQAHNYDEGIY